MFIYNHLMIIVYCRTEQHSIFWKMVKTPSVRRALIVGCGMQMIQQLAGINTVMYVSLLLILFLILILFLLSYFLSFFVVSFLLAFRSFVFSFFFFFPCFFHYWGNFHGKTRTPGLCYSLSFYRPSESMAG